MAAGLDGGDAWEDLGFAGDGDALIVWVGPLEPVSQVVVSLGVWLSRGTGGLGIGRQG